MQAGVQAELARMDQVAQNLAQNVGSGLALPGVDAQAAQAARPASFADTLSHALRGVDAKEQDANARMEAVENGESDDLVGAMLSSQQASLSFSMLMQVRNKVVGAVDELIKLPL